MSASPVRVGTAGWSVPSRYAAQMPHGGTHLQRYAGRLSAVEINSSFYRPHQRKTYERWAQSTPAGFRFSVKLPKAITHEARLRDCGAMLDRFTSEIAGLEDKLGVLLVQLPPTLRLDKQLARRFFHDLHERNGAPVALEPRHPSWFEPDVGNWLAKLGIARVAADPARTPEADRPDGWNGLAYYRWHGSPRIYYSDYDIAALSSLKKELRARQRPNADTWFIFDNTALGAAFGNALKLAQLLA